jgi:hypothetical protein
VFIPSVFKLLADWYRFVIASDNNLKTEGVDILTFPELLLSLLHAHSVVQTYTHISNAKILCRSSSEGDIPLVPLTSLLE